MKRWVPENKLKDLHPYLLKVSSGSQIQEIVIYRNEKRIHAKG